MPNNLNYYRRTWDSIHRNAAYAVSKGRKDTFCSWMRRTAKALPCAKCRNHALQYISNNPPEYATDVFVWAWEFHNEVNTNLRKPIVGYSAAASRYL